MAEINNSEVFPNTEIDSQIQTLYEQYKVLESKAENPSLKAKISRRIGRDSYRKRKLDLKMKDDEITDLLSEMPGLYSLSELRYGPEGALAKNVFTWGFDYKIGNHTFFVDYGAEFGWGIIVQGHEEGFEPKMEVLSETDKRNRITKHRPNILHLPKGYEIPVGPLYFKDDDLPMSEKKIEAEKAKTVSLAKRAGIKVDEEVLSTTDKLLPESINREHTPRYFRWRPDLTDNILNLTIDYDSFNFRELAIVPENADVINKSINLDFKLL